MKHLKIFETVAGFQAAQATLDLPNVSLIEATMGVNYLPYVAPVVQQHDYVEIGGVKWATMNVGANSITDTGLYFQWGDTQGYTASQCGSGDEQKYFSENDYIYYNDDSYTKYNSTDGKTVLDAEDDAVVTAAWDGNWRMPTAAEYTALRNAVTTAWTADYQGSGVAGLVCTDKTDSSKVLFFPAAGIATYGNVLYVGNSGYYWSSSLYDYDDSNAYRLAFSNDIVGWDYDDSRCLGFPVRGVYDESNS